MIGPNVDGTCLFCYNPLQLCPVDRDGKEKLFRRNEATSVVILAEPVEDTGESAGAGSFGLHKDNLVNHSIMIREVIGVYAVLAFG
mmetsp:Transcript_48210/g.114645  ORF Transcript_48210/g.114645 Transcript_48210/m.114645 type:complete len:86 (-) Transcript_48210:223-480(-)